jgi:hypothetical protein
VLCHAGRVELRAPIPDPGEPERSDDADWSGPGPEAAAGPDAPEPAQQSDAASWRVDRRLTIAKGTGAAIFALAAAIGYPDIGQVIVVGVAALMLAALVLRDLLVPVRLAADPGGVTVVTGFAGYRRLAWDEIDGVRVDARRGLLVRSQVLELDADDRLYFFSVNELGAPCDEVAGRLLALRP